MSKKMKRVTFDSSSHASYEDARARIKHQTLLQDFIELQQETEARRSNLMALKQKKLTLQAEVRFLRQRYKFLTNNKSSSTPKEQLFSKSHPTRVKKSKKEKVNHEKQSPLHNIKKKAPEFDLNLGNSLHVKEQSVQRAISNQRVRINGPKINPFLDSNPQNNLFGYQEPMGQKKPVIDLNQISREEEELQDQCQPFDHHHTNVRLSIFRNVPGGSGLDLGPGPGMGLGSGSRVKPVKRKISWQDPVALSVWGV
ncbi:uncharacterized protein LOC111881641 [Lactuca sativa]|uniref:Uncharacterized protein n=1 Tax=Lactuca sativa TaxID=4236 RepID=A0A9R1V3Y4_LACSA|nr:uncharacterized protein LOC111881641 [Lactuca sativa]KAJ0198434.1 hypothetical protein LSAT_V11C700362350 [Lactuca sativa]